MLSACKKFLRRTLPTPLVHSLVTLHDWRDLLACLAFLGNSSLAASFADRVRIVKQLYRTSFNLRSPHTQEEILSYIEAILSLSADGKGIVVEAGCFKGSSTAKFSLAADIAGRKLVVFDSFQGFPKNEERHDKDIFGKPVNFPPGALCGALEEVKGNVAKFGRIGCCRFVAGWFEKTMPGFAEPIAAIFLDVDLASSTRTCLKHLYPLLEPGGVLYSHDGHLPRVIEVFADEGFWHNEIGIARPPVQGLGRKKLIKIVKAR